MKKLYIFIVFSMVWGQLYAQSSLVLPTLNPHKRASITEKLGFGSIAIEYSRFAIISWENKVFRQLASQGFVPADFGMTQPIILETKAEEKTIFSFSEDVLIEEKTFSKGKYQVDIFLQGNKANFVFLRDTIHSQGLINISKPDTLHVDVHKTEESTPSLKYEFMHQTDSSLVVALMWGKLKIPLQIKTNLIQYQIDFLKRELTYRKNITWEMWFTAADFCYQYHHNLTEALAWADSSMSIVYGGEANFKNLILKGLLFEKIGKHKEAHTTIEAAIKKGNPTEIHQYARFLQGQKSIEAAKPLFRHNNKKFPNHWLSSVGMMRLYSAEKDYKKALKHAQLAQKRTSDPKNKAYLNKKIALLKENRDVNVEYLLGIDVSRWQYEIDWEQVEKDSQDIQFVFMKATQGIMLVDVCFEENWKYSHLTNIKKSAYHFFKIDTDPAEQAHFFIRTIGKDTKLDLPPVLDLEHESKDTVLTSAQLIQNVKIWLDIVEKAYGMKPIIYTAPYYWQKCLANSKELAEYPLWGAAVGKEGRDSPRRDFPLFGGFKEWAFWQYSWVGNIKGIDTPVDLNRFNFNKQIPQLKPQNRFSLSDTFSDW